MNISVTNYEDLLAEFSGENNFENMERASKPSKKSSGPIAKRRGKAPTQFNGIHRRRTKKIRW